MLQSFLSRLGRWSELPSSFEFTVCEEVPLPFALPCNFLLFNCRRKSDDLPASVFILHKKHASPSPSCTCSSTGGCCSSCVPSGAASGPHRQVTAVAAALTAGTDLVQQGKQHMKRVKTLLHPDLLKVLQTYESDAAIYIVTERCWPLPLLPDSTAEAPDTATDNTSHRRDHLRETTRKTHAGSLFTEYNGGAGGGAGHHDKTTKDKISGAAADLEATVAAAAKADVAWGLLQIANAVAFLQDSCQLVHGQVNPLSIFVTTDGSWKLSALELVRPFQPNYKNLSTLTAYSALSPQEQDLQQLAADQRRSAAYLQGWQPPESLQSLPLQLTDWRILTAAADIAAKVVAVLDPDLAVSKGQRGDSQSLISRSTDNSHSYSSKSYSSCYNSYGLRSSRGYGRPQLFELSSTSVRDTAPGVPPAARQFLQQLLSPVSHSLHGHRHQSTTRNGFQLMRLSDVVKQTPFFSANSTCNCMQFLREVHVKSAYEKEMFFEKVLPRQLHQPQGDKQAEQQQATVQPQVLPLAVQQQQVLPELMKLLDPTACTTSGTSSCGPVVECTSSSLTPAIVACVALIAAHMKSDDPASASGDLKTAAAHLQVQRLRVVLEKLFKSSDRALRYTLLTSLDDFAPLFTKELCERTFNSVLLGLVDSTPVIREATVKALVVFCQKIATSKVLQTCLEQLRRLTEDPEAVLRTNACICAAKICSLQETTSLVSRSERLQQVHAQKRERPLRNAGDRSSSVLAQVLLGFSVHVGQLLAQVLLSAMRDTFPLCRAASLQERKYISAIRIENADWQSATRIVRNLVSHRDTGKRAVAVAAVDPELSVAEAAVHTLQKLVSVAATAIAERRAATCTPEVASTAGGAANADESISDSQQQGSGSNNSMLTKAAASLSNPVAINFGNGGWFGVVARSLRDSLGVAGALSSSSCTEPLSASTTGPAHSYTVTSSCGTSATSSTYDTVSSSSSTKSMSCSVSVPPPPPPNIGHPSGPTAPPETSSVAAGPGRISGYANPPAAENHKDNFFDAWEVTEAAEDSVWASGCPDAWQDVAELAGGGLRNDSVVSGSANHSCRAIASHQLRGKGNSITSSLVPAASASVALSAPAVAFGTAVAAPAPAPDGVNLNVTEGLKKNGSREFGLSLSSPSAAARPPVAAATDKVNTSANSAAAISGTKTGVAAAGDDFFAEMERQLREQNY